jgi:hypothetical protein
MRCEICDTSAHDTPSRHSDTHILVSLRGAVEEVLRAKPSPVVSRSCQRPASAHVDHCRHDVL